MDRATTHLSQAEATQLAVSILQDHATATHALLQAELLVDAEMRGHPSHGLLRLPRLVRRIRAKTLDPDAAGTVTWQRAAVASVDGGNGFGAVVARTALTALMERAPHTGTAVAAISRSNHLGMLAHYAEYVARHGFVLLAVTTSEALVHPWGGTRAMVGTNPLAIGVPTSEEPFVLDMATGQISMGKVHAYRAAGRELEPGWARDEHGRPTTDPAAAARGAIAPFGGAKGYGLGLAVEVLVAAMTSTALGRDVTGTLDDEHLSTKGDVFIVLDPRADSLARITRYLADIRESPPAPGTASVAVPGDRSRASHSRARRDGFAVPTVLLQEIKELKVHA